MTMLEPNNNDEYITGKDAERVYDNLNNKEVKKIATLKEAALEYETPQTKNIAELEVVSTAIPITEKVFKEGTDEEFRFNVISINNEEYRVPNSVLNSLKMILDENSKLEHFKVKKEGTGLQTKYTVIPLG
jgi:hypothetical protein